MDRPEPVTVGWASYAQSRTSEPVKGMLTGPVTMLAWSFVRGDQPLADTARQVALAMRDEIRDLEAAWIRIIQVDEPALRELLPLRRAGQEAYLGWAVGAFRLATSRPEDPQLRRGRARAAQPRHRRAPRPRIDRRPSPGVTLLRAQPALFFPCGALVTPPGPGPGRCAPAMPSGRSPGSPR